MNEAQSSEATTVHNKKSKFIAELANSATHTFTQAQSHAHTHTGAHASTRKHTQAHAPRTYRQKLVQLMKLDHHSFVVLGKSMSRDQRAHLCLEESTAVAI